MIPLLEPIMRMQLKRLKRSLDFWKAVVMLGICNDMEELHDRISCYINLGISMENIKIHPDNLGQNVEYMVILIWEYLLEARNFVKKD